MMNNIEYFLAVFFRKLFLFIPVKQRYKLFEFFGMIAYYTIRSRRGLSINNLKIAFPDKSEEEIIKIAKSSYRNFGKMMMLSIYSKNVVDNINVEVVNQDLIDKLYAEGNGVIGVTLHMGSFEAGGVLAKDNKKMYAVFRRQKNKKLNDLLVKWRAEGGIQSVLKGNQEQLMSAIKQKPILELVSDHYSDEVDVNFFGKKNKRK